MLSASGLCIARLFCGAFVSLRFRRGGWGAVGEGQADDADEEGDHYHAFFVHFIPKSMIHSDLAQMKHCQTLFVEAKRQNFQQSKRIPYHTMC